MRRGAAPEAKIRLNTRLHALSHRDRRGAGDGLVIGPRRCGHLARRLKAPEVKR